MNRLQSIQSSQIRLLRVSVHLFENDAGKIVLRPSASPLTASTARNPGAFQLFEDYFREVASEALQDDPKTRAARFVNTGSGSVQAQVASLYRGPGAFHNTSTKLANQLLGSLAGGAVRPAYFILAEFRAGKGYFFAILKLDHDEHLEIRLDPAKQGPPELIVHDRDLPTASKHKDKMAFIGRGAKGGPYELLVTDRKYRGRYDRRPVARYFLEAFLGAELAGDSRLLTEIFFDVPQRFVRERLEDMAEAGVNLDRYFTGIRYFAFQDTVNLARFAQEILPESPALQEELRQELSTAGLDSPTFDVDRAYVEERTSRRRLLLSNGITIAGEGEAMGQALEVARLGELYRFELTATSYLEN